VDAVPEGAQRFREAEAALRQANHLALLVDDLGVSLIYDPDPEAAHE
jgi:hypothetical protein